MPKALRVVLVAAVLLSGCVAHEKSGDRAASTGDWKTAFIHYRDALANEDEPTPALKQKFEEARGKALQDARRRGEGCAQAGDWTCALGEADFAVMADPNNPDVVNFRAQAASQVALQAINSARSAANQGRYQDAVNEMQRAATLSSTPEVTSQAETARREIVTSGTARVDSYRRERRFDEALDLANVLAKLDGSLTDWVHTLESERGQFQEAEYDRLVHEGDVARQAKDWPRALERYQVAAQRGGRATALVAYVQRIQQAENAVTLNDMPNAIENYRQAVQTGVDDGYAAQRLTALEPHPYRIAIRSVLVAAGRSDGQAWVGPSTPLFYRSARNLEEAASRRGYRGMEEAAGNIPYENRPNLRVEVTLPDGARLATPARNGVMASFDSELVFLAQAADDRQLTFQVFVDAPGRNDVVGTVDVSLRELLERDDLRASRGPILSLQLVATRADGRQPGTSMNMTVLNPGAPNVQPAAGAPPPPGTGAAPAAGTVRPTPIRGTGARGNTSPPRPPHRGN